MASYASDSEEEDASYTETNVLLGYVSPTPSSDTISYIGGTPEWLDPSSPASASLARCKVCNDMMVLLLQLNGELPDFPGHERRLYIFSCIRQTCRRKVGSVRALRGVKVTRDVEKAEKVKKSEPNPSSGIVTSKALGESLFGAKPGGAAGSAASQNPFAPGASTSVNPFSSGTTSSSVFTAQAAKPASASPETLPKTFASALNLNKEQATAKMGPAAPPEPWPTQLPEPFPKFFFDQVENEQLYEEELPVPQATMMDVDEDGGSSSGPQKEEKDAYEGTMDKEFQKFADRLAQNPEQVIRYDFRGQPLLYSKTDTIGKLLSPPNSHSRVTTSSGSSRIPRCQNCGGSRVFEVQMTPHAIVELENGGLSLDGMDWGTIIVGVCEKDCTPNATRVGEPVYLEEWAGVQWEELQDRRG